MLGEQFQKSDCWPESPPCSTTKLSAYEYEITERADGTYLVDAQIPFYNFLSRFEKTDWLNEAEHNFDTLAGFVLNELEHIPKTGETFEWRGFSFEIIDMDGQRIDKLLLKISEEIKEEMEE